MVSLCRWWIYSMGFNPCGGVKELSGSAQQTRAHAHTHTDTQTQTQTFNWATEVQVVQSYYMHRQRGFYLLSLALVFPRPNFFLSHFFFTCCMSQRRLVPFLRGLYTVASASIRYLLRLLRFGFSVRDMPTVVTFLLLFFFHKLFFIHSWQR